MSLWSGAAMANTQGACSAGKASILADASCAVPWRTSRRGVVFLHWMEEEWPPRAQHVILTLWDMVDQFMEKADRNQVDMMAERALKNETLEEKEALQVQKEDLELEKLELLRQKEVLQIEKEEVAMRWRFSQSCCCALQAIVRNELGEKKRIWMVVVCLVGALVAMLFGVVLKMK